MAEPSDLAAVADLLVGLGCPRDKAPEMASQLDRRAHQLATLKERNYEDAMAHLLGLMRQGWAAVKFPPPE